MDMLDHLMDVMKASFDPRWREAWTRQQVENSLAMPHTYAILVDSDGELLEGGQRAAGFVLARKAPGEEELLLVAVRPEFRRRGIGARLIELFADVARENGAERIFLEMRESNPAEALYRAAGFEPIGKRPKYYLATDGTRIDAITFGRTV